MAEKKDKTIAAENTVAETYVPKRDFWASYSKPIIYGAVAIVVVIGGWFGYQKLVKEPKENKAAELIFPAESLFDKMAGTDFNKDSVNIVLNGGLDNGLPVTGLLKIISAYGGTAAGNRAKYMAGAAFLHAGDFEKAVNYLKEFDANGAYQLDIKRDLLLGDAYAEEKKSDEALEAYKKAAEVNEKDGVFTADALVRAAAYAAVIGKKQDAIELYQKAKDNFPAAEPVQSGEVDKYLAQLGVTK